MKPQPEHPEAARTELTAKGHQLSAQDMEVLVDQQKRNWQAVNHIAKVRVILKALSGKGRNDKVTCSIVCDKSTISETVELGKNEA